MGAWGKSAAAVAAALVSTFVTVPSGWAGAGASRFGDAKVLAEVPPPGFPEGIAVRGNTAYVAGPATFGTTGGPPSMVWAFDTDSGALVASYPVAGEDTTTEHANSSVAFAGDGRLYVLNTQLGLYRLEPGTGVQDKYGNPFPDLRPCPLAPECSPTLTDAPPIPNDLAFDSAGNAYVTDSTQGTIWRVPAGGGEPERWFQDQRLASEYIGVNGIRFNPERTHLFLTVSTDLTGRSFVYTLRLPSLEDPSLTDESLQPFHEYLPGELPDGLAFGRSGLLYVAMANPDFSGVSVLRVEQDASGVPRGNEVRRLSNAAASPGEPYDSPANIAFDGKGSMLLTNHAFTTGAVDPDEFNVLSVFVDEKAYPLEKPAIT